MERPRSSDRGKTPEIEKTSKRGNAPETRERMVGPERFREEYQGRNDIEIAPVHRRDLDDAMYIITFLKGKAKAIEINDCLLTIGNWADTHPLLFKDSTTDDQRKQLTELFGRAMSDWRTCLSTRPRFSDQSVAEFKDSTEAYAEQYSELLDKDYLNLSDLTDVGKTKALGYSVIGHIKGTKKLEKAQEEAKKDSELRVFIADSIGFLGEKSPSLYFLHEKMAQERLQKRSTDIEEANWPTDPYEFVRRAGEERIPPGTPIYDAASDLYSDFTNPRRSDVSYTMAHLRDEIESRE